MRKNGSERAELAKTDMGVGPKSRIYFADYLRAALVSLVVLHHISITHGASGSFYETRANIQTFNQKSTRKQRPKAGKSQLSRRKKSQLNFFLESLIYSRCQFIVEIHG